MVRNPDWWGTAEYPHNVDRVIHVAKVDPDNVAALLAGRARPDPDPAVLGARADPQQPYALSSLYKTKLHTMFFGLDQGSAELRSSNVKGRNPFKDRRVREAMAYAMDMEDRAPRSHGRALHPCRHDRRAGA